MPAVPNEPFSFITAPDAQGRGNAHRDPPRPLPSRSGPPSASNKIPRYAEADDGDDGFTTVPLKKRKRNNDSTDTAPTSSKPPPLMPSVTLNLRAPAPMLTVEVSRTLDSNGPRRYPPLPATIRQSRPSESSNRTAAPENDFPSIEGDCPEYQVKNVTDECRDDWLACTEPKMYTQVFSTNACGDPGHISDISAYLRQGLEAVSGETNFRVSPPIAEIPAATSNDPPFHYLVTNPDPAVILALIKQRIHSLENPPITFECSPVDSRSPYLICTIRGFSSTITKEAATRIVDGHIRNSTARILVERQQLARCPCEPVSPEFISSSVDSVMDTLKVEVLPYKKAGGALSPLVNVYLYTTARTVTEWYAWRDAIVTTVFTSFRDGTGTGMAPTMCTNCHGMDHPTGLCPFEPIPGWNGPAGRQNIERIRSAGSQLRGRGGKSFSRGRSNGPPRRS